MINHYRIASTDMTGMNATLPTMVIYTNKRIAQKQLSDFRRKDNHHRRFWLVTDEIADLISSGHLVYLDNWASGVLQIGY